MTRRFGLFVGATFAVTWTSWWLLVRFAVARAAVYGQLPFMMLYFAGGLGPTIVAYVAVIAKCARDPLAEWPVSADSVALNRPANMRAAGRDNGVTRY